MQEGALGRKDEARARFEEAARRDPATARARGHLADIAISRGELARADELLAQAILWNDDDAETWGTVARLAVARGDSTMARRALEQAIQLAPGEARLRMNAGSLFWKFGETERAKQEWTTALQIRPELARYLGDFRRATASDPPPPFVPLFTFDSFEAGGPPRQ
jgi:tetratricopeptide (TPR) repeat protein